MVHPDKAGASSVGGRHSGSACRSSFGTSCSDGRLSEALAPKPSHGGRYRHAMAITSLLDIQLRPDSPADVETRITSILSDTRTCTGLVSADVVRDLDDPRHLVVV